MISQTELLHQTSGDVAIYNVTAYIHEMLTGTQYALHNASAKETAGSKPTMMEKIDEDESKPLPSSDAKDTGSASRKETKLSAMEEMEFHSPVDVTITFLPINSAGELHKKSKYHKLFDIIYFSNRLPTWPISICTLYIMTTLSAWFIA
jgi:hypothetical protein